MDRLATPDEIVAFWREAGADRWFAPDPAFDAVCRERFLGTYEAAADGTLVEWEGTPEGALALLILLDQMPRNMFRGTKRVYRADPLALSIAERAIDKAFDERVEPAMRTFFYLPFEHAEDPAAQERCVALYEGAGLDATWARHHRDIIARFGRFPHRNEILGRPSSEAELAYLASEEGFRG
jgi:uncharacterized protein (DUF924 family)